jgi:hypothetical protein
LSALTGRTRPRSAVIARLDRATQGRGFSALSLMSLEYWIARSLEAKTRFALLPGDDD